MLKKIVLTFFLFCSILLNGQRVRSDQRVPLWQGIERNVRYYPDGDGFVIANGEKRFNRAIYGTNTGFRIETGDLPEFAFYLPGMGGNFKLALISGDQEKWLIHANNIIARYQPGSMIYEIEDELLGQGKLTIAILATHIGEGMLAKIQFDGPPEGLTLAWAYGGANGKKFHRNGDIGADPESCFYLKPEYCTNDSFSTTNNSFVLKYRDDRSKNFKEIAGIFPSSSKTYIVDPKKQNKPSELFASVGNEQTAIAGKIDSIGNKAYYFSIYRPESIKDKSLDDLPKFFEQSEKARKQLAQRIEVVTPDKYINTLGGALSVAADAVWQYPAYLHGAVAWRMHLPGWRGAYVADPMGWHERAKIHFKAYAKSQYLEPSSGPSTPDTETNLAREQEKKGTALFTSGYISRSPGKISKPHHYDMNQVYIDALLNHFNWTGDTAFVKEMWPAIKRSLEWEERCFDMDDDGLYTSYCAIWASDALEYNGGGATHSSAYNYKAFKTAAKLAALVGENPEPYQNEANKILSAINEILWIPEKGWFAEYKDILGNQALHAYPGVWTVYHALDSDVPNPFQAYQTTKYIDNEVEPIPIVATGLEDKTLYCLPTSNWMPYTWSVNNVALSEMLHTSLAFWQANRPGNAFRLWKGALVESMFLGSSPGNFQQLSFYDAMRGELYRDFADPIGMAARSLVEGLFGIVPKALDNTLLIRPGFPKEWKFASISIPDVSFLYEKTEETQVYTIIPNFRNKLSLELNVDVAADTIEWVLVNGDTTTWEMDEKAVGNPKIIVKAKTQDRYKVEIKFKGNEPENLVQKYCPFQNELLEINTSRAEILEVFDPQAVFSEVAFKGRRLEGKTRAKLGEHTFFAKLAQGNLAWWAPVNLKIEKQVEFYPAKSQNAKQIAFQITNFSDQNFQGQMIVNPSSKMHKRAIEIQPNMTNRIQIDSTQGLIPGTNRVEIRLDNGEVYEKSFVNWEIGPRNIKKSIPVNISAHFNDKTSNIFKNKYLSPRSPYPTVQIPWQGVGNWCSFGVEPEIDDSGLRNLAGESGEIMLPQGIPFLTPGNMDSKNIVFTSLWDNYPNEISIPLKGKASHAYLMMAGTTNPMQCHFANGVVVFEYQDGSKDSLELINPETWWPIEQDYYIDGFAFSIDAPKPIRVHLKTGLISREFNNYTSIKGFSQYGIEGGAATILDLPLNKSKKLKSLKIITKANDVIIGLMGLTLIQ